MSCVRHRQDSAERLLKRPASAKARCAGICGQAVCYGKRCDGRVGSAFVCDGHKVSGGSAPSGRCDVSLNGIEFAFRLFDRLRALLMLV